MREAPVGSSLGLRAFAAAVSAGEGPGRRRVLGSGCGPAPGEGWRLWARVSAFCRAKFLWYRVEGLRGGRGRAAPLLSWKLRDSFVFPQEGPSRPGEAAAGADREWGAGTGSSARSSPAWGQRLRTKHSSATRRKWCSRRWRGCGVPEGWWGRVARSHGRRRREGGIAPLLPWRPPRLPRERRQRGAMSHSLPREPGRRSESMRGLTRHSLRPRCFAHLARKKLEEREAGAVRGAGWCPVAWP